MSIKANIAAGYRRVVPEPIRRFIRNRLSPAGYSRAFFDNIDEMQAGSYEVIAASLVETFAPRFVVDVGCGSGGLLAALARHGVPKLLGLESSADGLARARRRNVDARFCDLGQPFTLDRDADLAICLEVAEHLPAELADRFIDSLTSGPKRLVFSAATPGQGGEGHVNEQPHEYWIGKLAARGFALDEETSRRFREEWKRRDVARWYCNNVMVFSA